MKVIQAVECDVSSIANMVANFAVSDMLRAGMTFDAKSIIEACLYHIREEDSCVFVCWNESEDEIVGIIGGTVDSRLTDNKHKLGWEIFYYIKPEFRGNGIAGSLMEEFEKWCKEKGAKSVIMSCMQEVKGREISVFYRRRGYKPYDATFIKDI